MLEYSCISATCKFSYIYYSLGAILSRILYTVYIYRNDVVHHLVVQMGYRTRVVSVNLNWNDDEWNFNAYSLDDNTWNEGNLFLSFETGDIFKA